jgi:hypothetical protein
MAILSKTGIINGTTIEASHITQSIDAFTGEKEYDIFLSGSFNMTGSINGEPGIVNPLTASNSLNSVSSSYALSSSFAVTASYAMNAGVGLSTTLTFFHNEVSGTLDNRETFIGGFACAPYDTSSRIGLISPISGSIIKASVISHSPNPELAEIVIALSTDGGLTYPTSLGTLSLNSFVDKNITNLNIPIDSGDLINVRLREVNTTSANWNINVVLIIQEN